MFIKSDKQREAVALLSGPAKHIMLYGGSRSGKSVILMYAMIVRALKCKSRHVILRLHFSHVKQSVWLDTLPKVMDLIDESLRKRCKWNQSDFYCQLPNGSEIWIGGLDDKDRTEKILGREFSTIWFNECSQISLESRDLALTRLAEKNELAKKAYYDENPPKKSHWSYHYFIENLDVKGSVVSGYASLKMNPRDNERNIDKDYIKDVLENLPPMQRARFLDGDFVSDDTDIFKPEWLIPCPTPAPADIAAVFAFIDPATTEKARAKDHTCETAIVVVAALYSGLIVDLEVQHGFWDYQEIKRRCIAVDAFYKKYKFVFGVEDVQAQGWLVSDLQEVGVNAVKIPADSDKVRRAISVTDLLASFKCRVNDLALRKQLLSFPSEGLKDLCDAYVYALRLYKKYKQQYVDPRTIEDFTGYDNETYQRLRVDKFKEQLKKRAREKADGVYRDPTLGKRW